MCDASDSACSGDNGEPRLHRIILARSIASFRPEGYRDVAERRPDLISAAVIAGGKSSRMGTDKALLTLELGGPTLLQLVVTAVRTVADDVIIIASDRPHYARFGARVEPDHYPGGAALGAIATALEAARAQRCLVVPCDLPFLNPPLLTYLADLDPAADVVIPAIEGESRQGRGEILQTLHAVYSTACLEPIRARLRSEQRQVIGFFPEVRVRKVQEAMIRQFDPDLLSFFNANTPEALDRARAIATRHGH